jgi:hypothetical protein
MKNIIWLATIPSLLFTSCASIVSKTHYDVKIQNPNRATTFKVKDSANQILAQGSTSATANLKSSSGFFQAASYKVVSYKNSTEVATQSFSGTVNPWIVGNLFNLSGIVGFAIDGGTGAMYKLPDTVNINAN